MTANVAYMKRVLIIHGWGNERPQGHWHRMLATALRKDGHVVAYPQLPDTELPSLAKWLAVVKTELDLLNEAGDGELLVFAHSLGCLTWLHISQSNILKEQASRVMLVAPADPELCGEVPDFQLNLSSPEVKLAAHKAAKSTLLVGSDLDSWLPRGIEQTYSAPLDLPYVLIPGAGHFAIEEGWTPWQGVINWVNDADTDLTVR
jgi:predicted alpha/beta hydrolase family esterase